MRVSSVASILNPWSRPGQFIYVDHRRKVRTRKRAAQAPPSRRRRGNRRLTRGRVVPTFACDTSWLADWSPSTRWWDPSRTIASFYARDLAEKSTDPRSRGEGSRSRKLVPPLPDTFRRSNVEAFVAVLPTQPRGFLDALDTATTHRENRVTDVEHARQRPNQWPFLRYNHCDSHRRSYRRCFHSDPSTRASFSYIFSPGSNPSEGFIHGSGFGRSSSVLGVSLKMIGC